MPNPTRAQNHSGNSAEQGSVAFTAQDFESLSDKLCAQFSWTAPQAFQLAGIIAQLERRDVVIHVATSMGKTAVAAGPFVLDKCAGMIVIYIIPLLALQDEMALTFPRDFGISAIAINSQTNSSNPTLINDVVNGKY